jgi:hypothetical protein
MPDVQSALFHLLTPLRRERGALKQSITLHGATMLDTMLGYLTIATTLPIAGLRQWPHPHPNLK